MDKKSKEIWVEITLFDDIEIKKNMVKLSKTTIFFSKPKIKKNINNITNSNNIKIFQEFKNQLLNFKNQLLCLQKKYQELQY